MIKGLPDEIASLTNLPESTVETALASLQEKRMVEYKIGTRILRNRSLPAQPDPIFHVALETARAIHCPAELGSSKGN